MAEGTLAVSIPVGSRVALKDGFDNVYLSAVAGSEGCVRARKEDEDGFPLIFIEWDKEHWRYNNQVDGWTFESHFKVLEEGDEQAEERATHEFLQKLKGMSHVHLDDIEGYLDELANAMEIASEGEGFILITVNRHKLPGATALVPEIFTHFMSMEAGLLLDAQLAHVAATNYQEMIQSELERKMGNQEDEDES